MTTSTAILDLTKKISKYSVKTLKKQQIYLNNDVVSDYDFITMVNNFNLAEYYMSFQSDTLDKSLLCEYILMTEIIFIQHGIEFKSLLMK